MKERNGGKMTKRVVRKETKRNWAQEEINGREGIDLYRKPWAWNLFMKFDIKIRRSEGGS